MGTIHITAKCLKKITFHDRRASKRWCIDSKRTSTLCSRDLETTTVDCRPFYSPREFASIVLMGVYIPPDAGATSAMKLLAARVTATESAHPDSIVIVLGDFNHTHFKKFLPRYKQHVDCATRNDKTLDHCYTVHNNAYNALVRAPLGESDHSTVLLIPTYRQKLRTNEEGCAKDDRRLA